MTPRMARARTPSRAGRWRPDTARTAVWSASSPLDLVEVDSSSPDTGEGYRKWLSFFPRGPRLPQAGLSATLVFGYDPVGVGAVDAVSGGELRGNAVNRGF